MSRNLSGWLRIGIVLSVIGSAWSSINYILKHGGRQVTSADFFREACYSERSKTPTVDCSDVWYKSFSEFPALNWYDLFLAVVVPLLLAWLIALIVILAARWIWAGFKPQT